ncbi:MAG: hypothetical protein OSJ73_11715 [Lachnospiraceae bacterium]|nr:hypothetical protein [Lachnospiraceae bacterium]
MDNNSFDKQNQNTEQGQYQQTYQQPYQQQYQQQPPYQAGDSGLEEPVSFGDWMVTMLLLWIPCVNIIMLFVWAFGSGTKKSKSNYCKAMLIWMVIGVVLSFVLAGTFATIVASILQSEGIYY